MMKKLVIAGGILIALCILIFLALEFIVDLNVYNPKITALTEKALHRKATLGNISHTLLRGPGAKVRDVKIFEPDQSELFVQVKEVIAKVKLLPLLSKRLEVSTIILNEPVITIQRNSEGGWNFDDLRGKGAKPGSPGHKESSRTPAEQPESETGTQKPPAPPEQSEPSAKPEKSSSPLSKLAIDLFRLRNGTLRFIDDTVNVTTELSRLNLDVNDLSANSPIRLNLAANLNGGQHGKIKASGDVGPLPADGDLKKLNLDVIAELEQIDLAHFSPYYQHDLISKRPETVDKLTASIRLAGSFDTQLASQSTISLGDTKVEMAGTFKHAQRPTLDFRLASKEFSLEQLLVLFPVLASMPLQATGKGSLQASANGQIDDLAVQAMLNLDQSAITYGEIFAKTPQSLTNLTIEAHLENDAVILRQFLITLGSLQLTTIGKIADFNQPQLDLNLETNVFDLQNLRAHFPTVKTALPRELTLEGLSKLYATVTGPLDELVLSGSLDLTQGHIAFGDAFAKPKGLPGRIEFDIMLKSNVIELRRVQLNINDVLFDLKGLISKKQQEQVMDVSLTAAPFALANLHPLLLGLKIKPNGTAELNLRLNTSLAHITPAALMTGTVRVSDASVALPQLRQPIDNVNTLINIQGDVVTLKNFSAAVGKSSLHGAATLKHLFSAPDMTFRLQSPSLNLDEILEKPPRSQPPDAPKPDQEVAPSAASPQAQSDAEQPLPTISPDTSPITDAPSQSRMPAFFQNMVMNGTVNVAQGQTQNVHFTELSADVVMKQGVVTVDNLFFNLYDGKYQGFVKLDLNTPDPRYEFRSKLVHVNTNAMLTENTSLADVVYGFMFADAALGGQGFKTEQLARTLSGNGSIKIENGKFTTFDLWEQLGSLFQMIGSVGNVKELTGLGNDLSKFVDETQFARFEGTFALKDGSAGSTDLILEISGQDLHIAVLLDGTFGLDTALNFTGRVRIAPESKYYKAVEKHFRDFKQADGAIELPFPIPIGGTLLQPEINMQSAQKSMGAFAKELAKQAVKSQVEQEVLKLLEGQSSQAEPAPAPETEGTPTELQLNPTPVPKEDSIEKAGEKLLKDLFKKKKK